MQREIKYLVGLNSRLFMLKKKTRLVFFSLVLVLENFPRSIVTKELRLPFD